ncbi:sulfatase [Haloarcula sp. GH36]|uniref:sulfatase n=1 Tax=Haloarcula montana TaxID=3111776 RepID=UPI002D791DA3|nr:sulfatase [Haloarcula sp. GH36]
MNRPNILFIVMDSVSARRLPTYGYTRETMPCLESFGNAATVYENVYANSSWTVPTHGTLFTGQYPSAHGAHANHKYFNVPEEETLAQQLSDEGYHTVGLSTNPWISTDFGYDTGFDEFHDVRVPVPYPEEQHPRNLTDRLEPHADQPIRKYAAFLKWAIEGNPAKRVRNLLNFRYDDAEFADGEELNRRVVKWLDGYDGREPFFMFLNYMDGHEPYHPSEEHLSEFREGDCDAEIEWHLRSLNQTYDEATKQCINDKYDASLLYLDEQLDALFTELEARSLDEDTYVVVTADHGKCLDDYMGVGTYLYDDLVQIPLIVATPERRGERKTEQLSQVDIHEKVLDMAGISVDSDRPSGSFAETLGSHQDVVVDDHTLPPKGLQRIDYGDRMFVRDTGTGEIRRSENLGADGLKELEELEEGHLAYCNSQSDNGNGSEEMKSSVQDRLERLGYL